MILSRLSFEQTIQKSCIIQNMGTKEDIGKKLKAAREKKGLTQAEVAEKAGIHPNYYARVERGEVDARANILEKIARALGVKSSDILPF